MRALLPFTKYHGLGNDFVLIDARELVSDPALAPLLANWSDLVRELAPRLCDRHVGIGADGVILALPIYGASELEPFETQVRSRGRKSSGEFPARHGTQMEGGASFVASQYRQAVAALTSRYPAEQQCELSWVFTNSDGSDAAMCGNGLRCLALWARLRGGVSQSKFSILTSRGPVSISFGADRRILVDVGEPILAAASIPALPDSVAEGYIKFDIAVGEATTRVVAIGMGNPHGVIFDTGVWTGWASATQQDSKSGSVQLKHPDKLDGAAKEALTSIALQIQNSASFPEGVNVEFVQVVSPELVRCYVYERGCGFTLACASGASAVVVAGVLEGVLSREVTVQLPGGPLEINYRDDNHILISGSATEVFSGVFKLEQLTSLEIGSQSTAEANCK